jgi:hypothetical protein
MRLNPLILRNVGTSSFAFAVCVIRYDTQGIIYFRGGGRYLRDPTKRGGHRAVVSKQWFVTFFVMVM